MLALMRFAGPVLTRSTLPRQAISRFTDGDKGETSGRQVSRGFSVRPVYTAIPSAFLLILLLLSLFTNPIHAETAGQEIKFTGKALASCAEVTVTAVAVEVEDVILGPQPCMRMLVINIGSHLPGYVDRSIQEGDKVEVYGEYTSYTWRECSVSLSESHHYIKKISDSGANKPPIAAFTWHPLEPEVGQTVLFTDQSYDPDGTIADRSWTYGDGTFGNESSHVYNKPGTFLACLLIMDNDDARNITCKQIKVRSHPTPPVDDDCSQSILVRGTIMAPLVTDSSSGYGYFFIRIAEVRHDTTGAVTVGELIQVRLSGSAFEALSEIAQGVYVEVCANWDTYLYCGELGYVRKVVPCSETDLLVSVDDLLVSESEPREIAATIHNVGKNDARAVMVQFEHGTCPCGGDIIAIACGPGMGRRSETIIDFIPKGGTAIARLVRTQPVSPGSTGSVWEWVSVVVDPYNVIPESNENNNEARKTISVCADEPVPCANIVVKGELISNPVISPFRHFDLRIDEVIKNRNNIPTIVPGQNIIVTFSSALDPTVGSLHTGNCVKVSGTWKEDPSQYIPGLRCDPGSCSDHSMQEISCALAAEVKFEGTVTEPDNMAFDNRRDYKVKVDRIIENKSGIDLSQSDEVLVHKWLNCEPGGEIIPEDWIPAKGDKVEVYGRLSEDYTSIPGHSEASYSVDLCGSDSYYFKSVDGSSCINATFAQKQGEYYNAITWSVLEAHDHEFLILELEDRSTYPELGGVGLIPFDQACRLDMDLDTAYRAYRDAYLAQTAGVISAQLESMLLEHRQLATELKDWAKSEFESLLGEYTIKLTWKDIVSFGEDLLTSYLESNVAAAKIASEAFGELAGQAASVIYDVVVVVGILPALMLPINDCNGLASKHVECANEVREAVEDYYAFQVGTQNAAENRSLLKREAIRKDADFLRALVNRAVAIASTGLSIQLMLAAQSVFLPGLRADYLGPFDIWGDVVRSVYAEYAGSLAKSALDGSNEEARNNLAEFEEDPTSEAYVDILLDRLFAVNSLALGYLYKLIFESISGEEVGATLEKLQSLVNQSKQVLKRLFVPADVLDHITLLAPRDKPGDTPDVSPPELTLSSPVEGSESQSSWLDVSGSAYDEGGIAWVRINGGEVEIESHTADTLHFKKQISLIQGNNAIHIVAEDVAGNRADRWVSVFFFQEEDTTPPSVEITDPEEGAVLSGLCDVKANASDDDSSEIDLRFFIGDTHLSICDDTAPSCTCVVDTRDLPDGTTKITVEATDESDNVAHASVGVTIANGMGTGELRITATCPVDLVVTDPNGHSISKSTNAIPEAIYTEADLNGDGDPDDQIIIPNRKAGDYQIRVIPEERAFPIDRYSLEVSDGFDTIVLADYVRVGDTPEKPYVVKSTAEGISAVNESETKSEVPTPTPSPKQGISFNILIAIIAGAVALVAIGVGVFLFLRSRYYI